MKIFFPDNLWRFLLLLIASMLATSPIFMLLSEAVDTSILQQASMLLMCLAMTVIYYFAAKKCGYPPLRKGELRFTITPREVALLHMFRTAVHSRNIDLRSLCFKADGGTRHRHLAVRGGGYRGPDYRGVDIQRYVSEIDAHQNRRKKRDMDFRDSFRADTHGSIAESRQDRRGDRIGLLFRTCVHPTRKFGEHDNTPFDSQRHRPSRHVFHVEVIKSRHMSVKCLVWQNNRRYPREQKISIGQGDYGKIAYLCTRQGY